MDQANVIKGNQGNLDANAGIVNSVLPGLVDRFNNPSALTTASQGYATDVLGGKYLGAGNPYLANMINQTAGDVSDRVNSLFGGAGRTGGTQHWQALGRELANSENSLRYQDYGNERTAMGQAAALAPSLTASEYAPLDPLFAGAQLGGTLPLAGAQATAGLLGPYTSTTQKQGLGSTLANVAGLGLMAFAPGFGGIKL